MVLFPKGGLGRLLLVTIIVTTLSYMILNMVSFGGNRWITYVDVPVRFGLWRVCDTTAPGLCNSWASQFASSITNTTFSSSKPGFIRSSQALEIIALIFYIFAAGLIVLGILNLPIFPYEIAFLGAAGLLFISIIFISATLGLMSVQGRSNHQWAFLDWAWWNGLAGLIVTIICFISLLSLVAYLKISSSTNRPPSSSKSNRGFQGGGMKNSPSYPPMIMAGNAPPVFPPIPQPIPPMNPPMYQPYNDYLSYNQYFPENYSNQFSQDPMMAYGGQGPPMPYGGYDPFMPYGQQNLGGPYFYEQSPSPLVSELARQYILQAGDAQYERELLAPYNQYLQDPYFVQNYF